MDTIFTKIIRGEIPCYKVAENQHCLAFLDIAPIAKGHTLVVPKKQIDYIFDLDDTTFTNLQLFSKQVAQVIAQVVPCLRIGTAVIGLEVPHAHIHLVPLNTMNDLNFDRPKLKFPPDEMNELSKQMNQLFLKF